MVVSSKIVAFVTDRQCCLATTHTIQLRAVWNISVVRQRPRNRKTKSNRKPRGEKGLHRFPSRRSIKIRLVEAKISHTRKRSCQVVKKLTWLNIELLDVVGPVLVWRDTALDQHFECG